MEKFAFDFTEKLFFFLQCIVCKLWSGHLFSTIHLKFDFYRFSSRPCLGLSGFLETSNTPIFPSLPHIDLHLDASSALLFVIRAPVLVHQSWYWVRLLLPFVITAALAMTKEQLCVINHSSYRDFIKNHFEFTNNKDCNGKNFVQIGEPSAQFHFYISDHCSYDVESETFRTAKAWVK